MLHQLRIFKSDCFDPYWNLALEKYMLDSVKPGECILYLWQNKNTVVIGRNQNPWAECRTSLLEEEGGFLARRLSGGGAVFHDLGNVNFTFLLNEEDYDLDKQLSVIQKACALAGISTEKSGRNDLLADGRKFSGNAFYHTDGKAYHHGTLLIDGDMEKLQRYLSPSKAKLEAKGVSSVRSRVINLKELTPTLNCADMKDYLTQAFVQVYDLPVSVFDLSEEDIFNIDALKNHYSSWDYLYGTPLSLTFSCQDRFLWGEIQIQLEAKNGTIQVAKVYSDAMDWALPQTVENALTGCRFTYANMSQELKKAIVDQQVAKDLCAMLEKQDL